MDKKEIKEYFCNILETKKDVSAGVAAIQTLMEIIKLYDSETVQGLDENLKMGIEIMKSTDYPVTAINSGCELFMRFITLARLDTKTFAECKQILLDRGALFLKKLDKSREKIIQNASKFIVNDCRILTHSRSRVVFSVLKEAAEKKKTFHVYVTTSEPEASGQRMLDDLKAIGIDCTLILDSAMGYVMEQVDFVMVGAEGVAESGGIINKLGSFTMAVCAKEMKKPFYVLTESFKFSRLFPLNQCDLPDEYKYTPSTRALDLSKQHPLVDYTPPTYITLLFTDLGILTPSAVSDELIKLYL